MKNLMLTVVVLALFISEVGAQDVNKKFFDEKVDSEVLKGTCDRNAFSLELVKDWFDKEYEAYEPDMETMNWLVDQLYSCKVLIVFGSWCHDSHREVPRFIKIWEGLELPLENLEFVALDTKKEAYKFDVKGNDIKLVPTFIVKRDGQEVGRIVESPNESLEKDLYKILHQ